MKKSLTILPLATIVLSFGFSRAGATDITTCGNLGPGSYVVKQNITAPAGTKCLVINGGPVTIDLNGFTITGNGGWGVYAYSGGPVTLRNGTLTGFRYGVVAPRPGTVVEGVREFWGGSWDFQVGNGATIKNSYVGSIVAGIDAILSNDIVTDGSGANLGYNAQVSDSVFARSGGLTVGDNATITHCTFAQNYRGLVTGTNAAVSLSSAYNNHVDGIVTSGGATVSYNTASNNGEDGFKDTGISTYTSNSATANGVGFEVHHATLVNNVASRNQGPGFVDSGLSTYQGNTSKSNDGNNFRSAGTSTFTGNTATNSVNEAGFMVVCPTNLIGNTAGQNNMGSLIVASGSGCNSVNNLF